MGNMRAARRELLAADWEILHGEPSGQLAPWYKSGEHCGAGLRMAGESLGREHEGGEHE